MSGLRDLKNRIRGIRSTQKITSAMKMVAAAKLRRAQEHMESGRLFSEGMQQTATQALLHKGEAFAHSLFLLSGYPEVKKHLILLWTTDRGLCGGFNMGLVRQTIQQIEADQKDSTRPLILCLGQKGQDLMRRKQGMYFLSDSELPHRTLKELNLEEINTLSSQLATFVEEKKVGRITMVYSRFESILVQEVTVKPLVPFENPPEEDAKIEAVFEFEPKGVTLLPDLLKRNLSAQLYQAFLETQASEHGARMTAMESATRNADDVIKTLELKYNRTRQANITRELIEIISGAEAL